MQSDTTVVASIAAVFLKKAVTIIATYGQKNITLTIKVILSGMYNCSFEAMN